jgi:hypothetical protein
MDAMLARAGTSQASLNQTAKELDTDATDLR